MSLLVIVPTRLRAEQCTRLMESFEQTADDAELLFVTDDDDDSYEEMDWRGHAHIEMSPRGTTVEKLNATVVGMGAEYEHLMWTGNDHVFVTPHWDTMMLKALTELGGSGWVYPNNGRRADIPETWLVSSDVVRLLNWFAYPALNHYYIDNVIGDLGKRSGLMKYCPDVIIEHKHYQVDREVEHDALYREAEEKFADADIKTFHAWRGGMDAAVAVSRLRRTFNPDVKWLLGKV